MLKKILNPDELLKRAGDLQRKLCAEEYDEILSMDDLVKIVNELTEPHLLTIKDFYELSIPAWKESRKSTRFSGWVVVPYGRMLSDKGVARYWSNPPTKEQREGTPWED